MLVTESLAQEIIDQLDLLVVSPGIPLENADVVRIKEKNVPIWGEIELAYQFAKGKIVYLETI
jgi:UDP-N-acetylmuramoylalanine--D-glutamate ligase